MLGIHVRACLNKKRSTACITHVPDRLLSDRSRLAVSVTHVLIKQNSEAPDQDKS